VLAIAAISLLSICLSPAVCLCRKNELGLRSRKNQAINRTTGFAFPRKKNTPRASFFAFQNRREEDDGVEKNKSRRGPQCK
jgi:hypothetical protein